MNLLYILKTLTDPEDYIETTDVLVFSAESYDACTVLEIVNDEDEETFLITLTAVTVDPYVALHPYQGFVVIRDDDCKYNSMSLVL